MRISLDRSSVFVGLLVAAFLALMVAQVVWQQMAKDAGYPVRFALPHISRSISFAEASLVESRGGTVDIPAVEVSADELAQAADAKPSITGVQSPAGALMRRPGVPNTQPGLNTSMKPGVNGVMPVEYDIGTAADNRSGMTVQSAKSLSGTLDVRKPIRIGQGAPARIDVKIGSGANIYLNGSQLASLFEAQGKSLKAPVDMDENGFVSVDDLRSSGLKIRYDAGKDALVVDGDV